MRILPAEKLKRAGPYCLLAAYAAWCLYDLDWAPRCLFHWVTGLDCPACGSLRALSSLAHGEWKSAFFHNPYLWVTSPYWGAVSYGLLRHEGMPESIERVLFRPAVVSFFACTTIVWWIFRNSEVWEMVSHESLGH